MCRCSYSRLGAACVVMIGFTITVISSVLQLGDEHRMQLQQTFNELQIAFDYNNFHRDYFILPWYVYVVIMFLVGGLVTIVLQLKYLFDLFVMVFEAAPDKSSRPIKVNKPPVMTQENMYNQIDPETDHVPQHRRPAPAWKANNKKSGRRGKGSRYID